MSKHMEFYIQDDATSIQIGKNVYRRVSIPIDDFNAACDHYGFVKERTCEFIDDSYDEPSPPKCSVCGYDPGIYECAWYEDGTYGYERNYCPNCGAKVVGE